MKPTLIAIVVLLVTFLAHGGQARSLDQATRSLSNPLGSKNEFARRCKQAGGHYTGSACECPKESKLRYINPYFAKCAKKRHQ
jgi:hypothetical protein